MTNKDLTLLERALFAKLESHEGPSGAGTPLATDDAIFGRIHEDGWFVKVPLANVSCDALDSTKEELLDELDFQGEIHAFAVTEPGRDLLGWLVLLFDIDGDSGYILIDATGEVLESMVEDSLFFEDELMGGTDESIAD